MTTTIEHRNPHDLRPHPLNHLPRWDRESQEWLDFVADIARVGVLEPLKITSTNEVVDGETRRLAAIAANLDQVPVEVVQDDQVQEIILRALHRRNLSKGQHAYLAVGILTDASKEGDFRRKFKKANESALSYSVTDRGVSLEKVCVGFGFCLSVARQAITLHRLLCEHPEYRAQTEASLFREVDPAGLGGLIAMIESGLIVTEREAITGIPHGGGRPKEVIKQLRLFNDIPRTMLKRWEYWKSWDEGTKREHFRTFTEQVTQLPPEECTGLADYYAECAKRLRDAVRRAAAAA